MASNIDESVPADNVKVDKALLRQNFQNAKDEIEELQVYQSLAWRLATGQTSI